MRGGKIVATGIDMHRLIRQKKRTYIVNTEFISKLSDWVILKGFFQFIFISPKLSI